MRAVPLPRSLLTVSVEAEDPLVRASLIESLRTSGRFQRVGASSREEESDSPDGAACLVWDAGIDPASALESLLGVGGDSAPVLMLVPDLPSVGAAIAAGAHGAVLRDLPPEVLAMAAEAVSLGLGIAEPSVLATLRVEEPAGEAPLGTLTAREREVLALLAEGLSNRAIASRLAISEHTAKFHVTSVMGKLGAQKRVEAVVRAAKLGVLLL